MQGYCSRRLDDVPTIVSRFKTASSTIYAWCGAKRLQLNADKTELLWFGPVSQLRQLPSQNSTIHINQCVVKPVTVVRDLGVWFNAELSMHSHVSRIPQTMTVPLPLIARPRHHSKTIYSTCPVASGLLQHCAGRYNSFHAGTVPASPACSGTLHTILDLKPHDRVTRLSGSCTGYQSLRGSSAGCACWITSRFWDTCQNTSQTF